MTASATSHVHVVGARPNFMKAAPVIQGCRALGEQPFLLHTGQHYDTRMSDVFFEQLGLPHPDLNLEIGSGSHGEQTGALMVALEQTFLDLEPTRIVVYGDINSTLAAAVVAAKLHVPIAHVEAGLRSFDRTMPEEINRVVTDALADLHFATSPEALAHLAREGIPDKGMYFVGNPMIDTLHAFRSLLDPEGLRKTYELPDHYGVVTLHRPANVDDPEAARQIVDGLRRVAKAIPLILPLHPRGRQVLMKAGLFDLDGVKVVDPLGYVEFITLVSTADLVLTDSGGIQEETTILEVPCLTLRENTERPITVSMGTNRLVGSDPEVIEREALRAIETKPTGEIPPLWDGKAGERIAAILSRLE